MPVKALFRYFRKEITAVREKPCAQLQKCRRVFSLGGSRMGDTPATHFTGHDFGPCFDG